MNAPGSVWTRRRSRARALLESAPHAVEILDCFVALTDIQERCASSLPVDHWLGAVRGDVASTGAPTSRGGAPAPDLAGAVGALPRAELDAAFEAFLRDARAVGTEVMIGEAVRLLDGSAAARGVALAAGLDAASRGDPVAPFHARVFLEVVLTRIAASGGAPTFEGDGDGQSAEPDRRCPVCGAAPVVGTLRDLPDALGARGLVCGLCGTGWRARRLECVCCGESDADRLPIHVPDAMPWLRVDECATCTHYLKTVDLRKRGDAVPLVDDLATVELDLWAQRRGLLKLQPNVFGL